MNKSWMIALSLVTLSACGASTSHESTAAHGEQHAAAAAEENVVAPGEARVGDRTRCPVNGEIFTVTADSPHAEHNGKTYYFCCSGCIEPFNAHPEQYVGAPATEAAPTTETAATTEAAATN